MTTLIPAYGRDYKSQKEVREAWNGRKDFMICDVSSADDGRYTSKGDWSGRSVLIRYNKLRSVVEVKG